MATKRARKELGRYLKECREELGLHQQDVAKRAGIQPSTVMRLENGDIENPRPDTLQQLAKALGVSFEDLFARIGYLDADNLPEPAPYFRTKFRDRFSEGAIKEAERFYADWERRHQEGKRGKRS